MPASIRRREADGPCTGATPRLCRTFLDNWHAVPTPRHPRCERNLSDLSVAPARWGSTFVYSLDRYGAAQITSEIHQTIVSGDVFISAYCFISDCKRRVGFAGHSIDEAVLHTNLFILRHGRPDRAMCTSVSMTHWTCGQLLNTESYFTACLIGPIT